MSTPPNIPNNKDNIDDVYRSPVSEPVAVSHEHAEEESYNMIDWFKKCLRLYADFSGRARRKEYWYFTLVNYLLALLAGIIDAIIFDSEIGVLGAILSIALFLPGLGVTIRRLHDTSRSGWWFLLVLIPILGWIALFVFLVSETKYESNQWGPPAK